jgi:hypothetical protein
MERSEILEKRPELLNGNSSTVHIPFLGGRPQRETVISRDEILNLTIILHTTVTIEDFLIAINY